jgi:hypothetical protein
MNIFKCSFVLFDFLCALKSTAYFLPLYLLIFGRFQRWLKYFIRSLDLKYEVGSSSVIPLKLLSQMRQLIWLCHIALFWNFWILYFRFHLFASILWFLIFVLTFFIFHLWNGYLYAFILLIFLPKRPFPIFRWLPLKGIIQIILDL